MIRVGEDKYVMASNVLGNSRVFKADAKVYKNDGTINTKWSTKNPVHRSRLMALNITSIMKLTIELVKMLTLKQTSSNLFLAANICCFFDASLKRK